MNALAAHAVLLGDLGHRNPGQHFADALDPGGWTEDDDSGYGPYSYFAHAMAKDD